jgi:hypothetical protein
MTGRSLAGVVLAVLALGADVQGAWWHEDPEFRAIAARLDVVPAIDNHTHLLDRVQFEPAIDPFQPLLLRSTWPPYLDVLRERFGVPAVVTDVAEAARLGSRWRERRVDEIGAARYWAEHLDAARVAFAIANQDGRAGVDGVRIRWVPHATPLMYPVDPANLAARNPGTAAEVPKMRRQLGTILRDAGTDAEPATLAAYREALARVLTAWKQQGALGIKFYDAYFRSILFEDVPEPEAAQLYARGRSTPLSVADYRRLQDHLARWMFLEAGRLGLTVHVHSSHGVPPWLELRDADVRNLEPVLTDPRFGDVPFVLIHGGAPLHEEAAYLALKPNVWIDLSAMPFLYPVPDLAAAYRRYLIFAPGKLLYSTDAGNYPGVPVGPEVQHLALARAAREALYLALAGLVRDGVLTRDQAVATGEGVLAGNARRLYGLK